MVLIEVFLLNIFNIFLLTSARSSSDGGSNLTPKEIVAMINALNTTWTAGLNPEITGQYHLNCVEMEDRNTHLERVVYDKDLIASLPESFDAREKWPNCPSISHIRNQGPCGSCWAQAVTGVISDRYCIDSNGTKQFTFSAQDLTSCDTSNKGCRGGKLSKAFKFWENTGIVSGGDYGSNEGCYPYEIPPAYSPTPPCKNHCRDGYNKEYLQDKQRGLSAHIVSSEGDMMAEIYKNGPITSNYELFEDFYYYEEGIYQHVYGVSYGYHAVRIIGWGIEHGVKYWLVANSWGKTWAEHGYFRIIRGHNECGIEDICFAAKPIV